MRFSIAILLSVLIIFTQAGCSIFRSGQQNFKVMTSDPNAEIYINNTLRGKGDITVQVPSNQSVAVRATKEGYKPLSRVIEKKLSVTGVLDTIGGWLIIIPFIGLAFPGAYELDNSNLTFTFTDQDKIK